jgi:hypothetical protein
MDVGVDVDGMVGGMMVMVVMVDGTLGGLKELKEAPNTTGID